MGSKKQIENFLNLKFWIAQKDVHKYLFGFTSRFDQIIVYANSSGYMIDLSSLPSIAKLGYLKILQWIHTLFINAKHWNTWVCTLAAENGHLKLLQWLRENDCPWDELTCAYAAGCGQLEVLQWARQQVPPAPWNEWTCALAVKGGHLSVLQWARENGAPPWNGGASELLAKIPAREWSI